MRLNLFTHHRARVLNVMIAIVALLVLLATGCGDDGDPDEAVTITIGNITDLTGPGASGIELTNVALEDMASYYNDNDIIPGVEFKVIHWDGQMDPAKTVPGYERLKQRGADVISTCAPGVAVTLEPRLNADKMVLFTQAGEREAIEPPGYIFCLGCIPQYEAYTLLAWIAENDWDYEENGPARIGAAAWKEPYAIGFIQAMKDYAGEHPEQFEFVDSFLPDLKFSWASEVEALKECDYIFPPIIMEGFAKSIRDAGSDARFIGGAPHTGFLEQLSEAGAWPAVDGMIFVFTGAWWTEDVEEVRLNKELLKQYHPGKLEEITKHSGYGSLTQYRMMFDLIEKTVETTGPEAFSSEALYETAQSWSFSWDYRSSYSFSPIKRFMNNDLCFQEASAEKQTLVRNDPDYYPVLREP